MQGEPRYVRFCRSRCWFGLVTQVCPAAIPSVAPHHRRVAPSVHSEDQRARVEGPSEGRVPIRMQRCPVRASGSYAYGGVRRRRSPPGLPSDIRCHRRARYPRRKPLVPITSRPRPSFQRHTAKRAAFQKTGMPVAATTRKGFVFSECFSPKDCSSCALTPALSLTPPTLFPHLCGRCFCWVLQVSRCGHPRSVTVPARSWVESTDAFFTPSFMPGTDDPSMTGGSTDSAVDGS